ncbi:MAG: TonB-dependent receptor [Acidobacteria bacterium]|nr:TonB-dependent receptor [Acidobacteriota bacterium]
MKKPKLVPRLLDWTLPAILALACVPRLPGQSATTGALEGTVKDAAGRVLPSVTVRLLQRATEQTRSAASDRNGVYRFSLLDPGTYEVTFSARGFKTSRLPEVSVDVSEVPVLDAVLEPGKPAELTACQCRISAAAPSSGTLVDQKTITAVPLNTRNFTQVLSMSSGSAADVNNAGTLGRGTQSVNVNGNTTAGAYTIDGAYAPSTVPNPDTISEFKIQTSQYDAGFGAMVPNTNLVTKRGENEVHGDGWEFLRNDILNANAFFRNSTGQPKPNLKQNQFGATLGGPLKTNKLFLFGSYQGTRQVNGLDPTSVSNPILPALGADRSAEALAGQLCPGNHPGDPRYLSFAGGKQLDCRNRTTSTTAPINPVALRILQMKAPDGSYLIPSPQTIFSSGPNAGLGFSSYSLPSTYRENHYLANLDYLLSAKNTLSGRVFGATIDQLRSFGSPGGYPGAPVLPGWGASQALTATDITATLKLTSVLTANVVNESSMSYTRNKTDTDGVDTPSAASVGMVPVDPLFPQPPEVTVLGPLGSFRLFGTNPNDNHFETITYSWADNLSWVRGKHRLRTGAFFLSQYNGRADTGGARGKIAFQTFADFLLGLSAADNLSPSGRSNIQTVQANEGVGPHGEVEYRYRRYYGAGFVQDDINLRSHLTLNLGLRWEYIGPSLDTAGTIGNMLPALLSGAAIPPPAGTFAGNTVAANYNPRMINPYTGEPFGPPPDGVITRSTDSFYENGTPRDTFAPRVGFAWQPIGATDRLVVGGGYGWFYQPPPFSGNAGAAPLFTSPPFAQGFTNTDASNNLSSFRKPFPDTTLGFVPRTPTSQLSDRVAGPEYRIPRLQQWNVTAKVRLLQTLSLDTGYVGSHGDRLLLARGLNQPMLASGANPVNCGYNGAAADCITTNTSLNAHLRVPIMGETPTALLASEFTGLSWYHSLQATLRKQFSRNIAFQVAYTLSRAESNTSVYNDQNDLSLDMARAAFDRTHRMIANFDYQLPAVQAGRFVRGLLNGWSVAGIVIMQSGLPITLTDPAGGAVYGRAGTSTVTLCPNASPSMLATAGGIQSRLNSWVNTAAICGPPALGSDGSTGYGNSAPSIMNGPGQVNTDFSLGKRTRVGGLRDNSELAFRVEFYNALNHPQFANPGATFGTATFGVITQTSVAPRLIQFGLKYLF